jgi:hypothetical protein
MEEHVTTQYENAFVDRIRTYVENQPLIKYLQIWNELKGYLERRSKPVRLRSIHGFL